MLKFIHSVISLFMWGNTLSTWSPLRTRTSCTAFSVNSASLRGLAGTKGGGVGQFPSFTTRKHTRTAASSSSTLRRVRPTTILNVESSKEGITNEISSEPSSDIPVPVHRAEGLCAVYKPLDWTSNDVVSYIRGMLERDARNRGAKLAKRRSKSKTKKVKVGHGGTLDPLATGVLVLGIGSGTKDLQSYLSGSKKYSAGAQLGFETATLDMEQGKENAVKTAPSDHVTYAMIEGIIQQFTGDIMQKPPIFSAIKKDGKRLYEQARAGKTEEDIEIEARKVTIHNLQYSKEDQNGRGLPCFGIDVECGGGTYIRSLIRDIGYALDSCATMTSLERTQQGQFTLDVAIPREDWSADNIYAAVQRTNSIFNTLDEGNDVED